jgi:hypothetical protein
MTFLPIMDAPSHATYAHLATAGPIVCYGEGIRLLDERAIAPIADCHPVIAAESPNR